MIHFIGDLHGDFKSLQTICKDIPEEDTVIQVGDFGFWPDSENYWDKTIKRPIFFIDGNHDYLPGLVKYKEETEVWPNAIYIPRGTIKEIEGYKILFIGGAASVDGAWRRKDHDYFPELEIIQEDSLRHINSDTKVDLMVTHTPPVSCVKQVFDPNVLVYQFGLSRDWIDYGTVVLEAKWNEIGNPPIVCGHMHRSLSWGRIDAGQIRILDINENITIKELGL